MRTERYRLVVWKDREKPDSEPVFVELYDHQIDPLESKNIAQEQPEILAELMSSFNLGWKGNKAS